MSLYGLGDLVEDPPGSGLYVPPPGVVEDPPGTSLYMFSGATFEDPPGSGLYGFGAAVASCPVQAPPASGPADRPVSARFRSPC